VAPPAWPRGVAVALRTPLGAPGRRVGALLLLGRALTRSTLASGFPQELGEALDHVWRLHRRRLRTSALNELTRLLVSTHSLEDVFRAFAEGVARLVVFDSVAVSLLDSERGEFEVVDIVARSMPLRVRRDARMPLVGAPPDELAALYATSRLITARLDVPSVLDRISQAVSDLIGSTGCGIGLLNAERTHIAHVAAHGFRSQEWRSLSIAVGEGIMGRAAQSGTAIRVDDVPTDPRSAPRDVDEREGIRSMLCVPLTVAGGGVGGISAFSTHPRAVTGPHPRVLGAFGEQARGAVHHARLFHEDGGRAPRARAPFQARPPGDARRA